MNGRYYLLTITITSAGTENRNLTPYDNIDTALRKFHEAFNVIGGGPKKIVATLLDSNLNEVKHDLWVQPEEEPTPETPVEGE